MSRRALARHLILNVAALRPAACVQQDARLKAASTKSRNLLGALVARGRKKAGLNSRGLQPRLHPVLGAGGSMSGKDVAVAAGARSRLLERIELLDHPFEGADELIEAHRLIAKGQEVLLEVEL